MNISPSPFSPLIGGVFVLTLAMSGLALSLVLGLHRAKPKPDWIEYGFIVLMLGSVLALWLGLVLASLGWFSIERLIAAVIITTLGGSIIVRKRDGKLPRSLELTRSSRAEAALVILLMVCSLVYFRPHEFVLGAADAGVYVNMGAQIARSGSLLIHDDEIAQIDPAAAPGLFRELAASAAVRYYNYAGFYLSDSQPGLVIPQFFAVQAVSIAIFDSIGGVWAGLYATPLWGLLGIAALYFFTRSLFGRRAALLAAILLACTPTQVWFARYPTAEVLTQACLFAGLYALTRTLQQHLPLRGWGFLAGAWIGLIFLTRIDTILVAVILIVALIGLALIRKWRAGLTMFTIIVSALGLHSIIHSIVFTWPYTWDTYRALFSIFVGSRWLLLVVGGLMGVVLVVFSVRAVTRIAPARRTRLEQWARIGLVTIVALAAIYAYFIRPSVETSRTAVNSYDDQTITITNNENLVRIGWYLTPIGLAASLIGVSALIRRERSAAVNLFVMIGLLSTVVYVINILNNPHQIYASRRYVPVVIPAMVVWGAYGLAALSRARDRRLVLLSGLIAIGWWAGMLWQARIIGWQVDDAGALNALVELDRRLEPDAVVLIDDQSTVGMGDTLGTPLHYIFDHPVFVLRAPEKLPPGWLNSAVNNWQQQGRSVFVIGAADKDRSSFASRPIAQVDLFTFEVRVLEPTYTHFPDQIVPVRYDLKVYSVSPEK